MRTNNLLILIGVVLFAIAGIGANTLLGVLASATFILGSLLTWRAGESPILFLIFLYQWAQYSVLVYYANLANRPIEETVFYGGISGEKVAYATVLAQVSLAFFIVGIRVGLGSWRPQDGARAKAIAQTFTINRLFRLYLFAFFAAFASEMLARAIPAISQPLLALAHMKWAFYFILAYASFSRNKGLNPLLLLAFAIELAWGLGGYFSDFKTVFIFTLAAAVAGSVRITPAAGVGLGALVAVLLTFGVVWSSIKGEYRAFVSGGEGQVVTVDAGDRFNKLYELVGALNRDALADGVERFLLRLTYVEFFGAVLGTVPEAVPHEGGAIWLDAIERPFMPRVLFPSKSVIDDSERTNLYTGLGVAGTDKGTSISIGYAGESYIDFGEYGMMAPLFALGALYGWFYRFTLRAPNAGSLFGMALATAILSDSLPAETSITKLVGGLMAAFLLAWLVRKFLIRKYLPEMIG